MALKAVLLANPEPAVLEKLADTLVNLHDKQRGGFRRAFGNPSKPHFKARDQMLSMLDDRTAPGLKQKIEAAFEQRWNRPATLSRFEDKEQNYHGSGVQTSSGQAELGSWEDRMRNHSAT